MAKILFFEKNACPENQKQLAGLAAAGFEVELRDLVAQPWTPASLRGFFADRPPSQWFDPKAPKILSGEINPATIDAQKALVLLALDPSLIRGPLVKLGGRCAAGLDDEGLSQFLAAATGARVPRSASSLPASWPGA